MRSNSLYVRAVDIRLPQQLKQALEVKNSRRRSKQFIDVYSAYKHRREVPGVHFARAAEMQGYGTALQIFHLSLGPENSESFFDVSYNSRICDEQLKSSVVAAATDLSSAEDTQSPAVPSQRFRVDPFPSLLRSFKEWSKGSEYQFKNANRDASKPRSLWHGKIDAYILTAGESVPDLVLLHGRHTS
jgi:hypothetical protein